MRELHIPEEIQKLLAEEDVVSVIVAIEWHDRLGEDFGLSEKDLHCCRAVHRSPDKENLVRYLSEWVLEHASFGQLAEMTESALWFEKALDRMAAITTLDEAREWVAEVLKNSSFAPGAYKRDRIMPFVKAIGARDEKYYLAVMRALLSYLDETTLKVEELAKALRKISTL